MILENAKNYQVLSIDAWASGEPNSWEWNNWHDIGRIELTERELDSPIEAMIEAGYLKETARELAGVDDDGYNIVIINKETLEPVYAIVYGQYS